MARNGPSGWYSQAWMSRADQSFTSNMPNTWSSARSIGTGSPCALGVPIAKPASSSMSSRRLGPYSGPGRCPLGRRTGVPLGTTVPARPWYPTGRCRQFGRSGSASGRNIRPTFVAWWSDE